MQIPFFPYTFPVHLSSCTCFHASVCSLRWRIDEYGGGGGGRLLEQWLLVVSGIRLFPYL
uniref:Uncharacterized protein n=1 Tax=Arundo donax TaxID=35708 RepID=A0A0A9BGH0_ARUDO